VSRILTPCLPMKSCLICESRLFPKAASPEKRAAKFSHQAAQYGRYAIEAVYAFEADEAYAMARGAARFVRMAETLLQKQVA
jgi:hypothetical protein